MTVELKYKNGDVNNIILNVWELQDNDHGELVVKFHNHECVRSQLPTAFRQGLVPS